MVKVIIDTSAWIDFFRNETGAIGDAVTELIGRDQVVITGPVLTELRQGLKNRQETETLCELLNILPFAEIDRRDWENTGTLLRKLRQKGITVPLTDALIAVVAKHNRCSVLTLDRHFAHLEVPLYPY